MSHPGLPDLDPYFSHKGKDGKKGEIGKKEPRSDLLLTEVTFRVAGMAAMILGAFVFVLFCVPVSGMLRHGDEPDGILLSEGWLWNR